MLTYFLLGALIGAATGIPIGPVNVAVIDSAYRHHVRRAIAVGLGGAIGDFIYALIGILGLGPFLLSHQVIPPILYFFSGLVLIVYGVLTARAQPIDPRGDGAAAPQGGYFWPGFALGAALILLNPAALITWVVIVGGTWGDLSVQNGWAAATGIGIGSLAWFSLVALLANRGQKLLGSRAVWITRIVGYALIAYGIYSLIKGIRLGITYFQS